MPTKILRFKRKAKKLWSEEAGKTFKPLRPLNTKLRRIKQRKTAQQLRDDPLWRMDVRAAKRWLDELERRPHWSVFRDARWAVDSLQDHFTRSHGQRLNPRDEQIDRWLAWVEERKLAGAAPHPAGDAGMEGGHGPAEGEGGADAGQS